MDKIDILIMFAASVSILVVAIYLICLNTHYKVKEMRETLNSIEKLIKGKGAEKDG